MPPELHEGKLPWRAKNVHCNVAGTESFISSPSCLAHHEKHRHSALRAGVLMLCAIYQQGAVHSNEFQVPPKAEEWVPTLNALFVKYDITTPKRIVAFLTQASFQTANFTALEEFTTPINKTWPYGYNRFCVNYPGGCKYKGRGILQLHGLEAYQVATDHSGLSFVISPELMSEKPYAFEESGYFWSYKGLNDLAESGDWDMMTLIIAKWQPDHQDRRLQALQRISQCYRPPRLDPSRCGFTYTCSENDTIDTITTRYRMLPIEILRVNPLPANWTSCNEGQQLYIPKC